MASKKTTGTAAQISANLEAARKSGTLGKLVGRGDAQKFGSGAIPTDAAGLNAAFGKSDIKVSGGSGGGKSSGGSGGSSSGSNYRGYDPKLFSGGNAAIDAHIAQQAKKSSAPAAPAGGAMEGLSGAGGFAAGSPSPSGAGVGAGGGLGATGNGGGGGAGTSSSFAGLMGAMGGEEGGNMPFAPPEALGLRAGLGQRAHPTPNLALAMLGKAY